MKFGAHVSIAGGIANAPKNAAVLGCEIFQIFTRSPQGGKAPELTPALIKEFKSELKKYKFSDFVIHAPYYINFASANNRIRYGSISVVREELERGSAIGAKYLMTHLGSAKDLGQKEAIKKTIEGLIKVLDDYHGAAVFLIENSAGAGEILGDTFDEIGETICGVIEKIPKAKIGVCLDTCHAFASGYDWRSKLAVAETLKKFDQAIGLKYLKLMHANDSLTDFNSHLDRHAHIGAGKIGLAGFEAIIRNSRLKNINLILETDSDGLPDPRTKDLKILKKFRDK